MPSAGNLEALPPELLHNVLSYLVAPYSGVPNTTGLHYRETPAKLERRLYERHHPFFTLAATSKQLRDGVESFCRHLVARHSGLFAAKHVAQAQDGEDENKRAKSARLPPIYRTLWVKKVKRHCAFCGAPCTKRAIFNSLLFCCRHCDRKEWPGKITMTEAQKAYHLTKLDLFTPNPLYPRAHQPRLRFAVYDCQGVETTMFRKKDLDRLARLVHGDNPEPARRKRQRQRNKMVEEMDIVWRDHKWHKNFMRVPNVLSGAPECERVPFWITRERLLAAGELPAEKDEAECATETAADASDVVVKHEVANE